MSYPTSSSASDVWSLRDVYKAEAGGDWPSIYEPPAEAFKSVDFTSSAGLVVTAASTIPMTGDWTIEGWCKGNVSNLGYWFDFRLNGGPPYAYFTGGTLRYLDASSSETEVIAGLSNDVWFHMAVVHSSGVTKFYLNGTEQTSLTDTAGYSNPSDITLAKRYTSTVYFVGYQTNFRVSSSAIYTGNFTAPTKPLPVLASTEVLVCAADTFIDRSGNNHTVTTVDSPVISTENPF